jgi:hypothetical protein
MTDPTSRRTGRSTRTKTAKFKTHNQTVKSCHEPQKWLDTKTDGLADRQSQRDLDLTSKGYYLQYYKSI